MSKAMQLIGIILLGIFTLVIIYLMSDVRSTNELDYYLLQEVTEASMYDAVDYSYYRESGLLKVDRDMFLESFNRRFAESVTANRDYEIKIIDFNETPPKVSIEVKAPTIASVQGEVALVTNRVSGIIETIYDDFVYSEGAYGTMNVDESAPTISFIESNNKYNVLIVDDYLLYGYKMVKLNDSNIHSASSICNSITKWDDPGSWVKSYVISDVNINNDGYWVAAIDASNNCSVKQLSDIAPWVKSLNYVQAPSQTDLIATLADDHGLKKYYIAPNTWSTSDVINKCAANSNVCKAVNISGKKTVESDGSIIYTTSINLKLNEQGLNYGTYRLFIVDSKNKITKSTQDLVLRQQHKPSVQYAYVAMGGDFGTLTLTFNDTGNDLYGYKYSTSNTAPVNDTDYTKLSSGKTLTLNGVKSGTYYIWAKDKQGDVTKLTLGVAIQNLVQSVTCDEGGTLTDNNTKCYYANNGSKCGTEGKDWDDCLTGSPSTCVGGYPTYTGTCTGSGNAYSSTGGCNTALLCPDKKNCKITKQEDQSCDSSGNCTFKCYYSYSCQKTSSEWNDCLTGSPSTCKGGYKRYENKSCKLDPTYGLNCPTGFTKSNDKACIKLSAS